MLNRRHIRIKVMQSVYAMHQQQSTDIDKQEKFLFKSIEDILDLYLIIISALGEIRDMEEDFLIKSSQKILKSKADENPNRKFIDNIILKEFSNNEDLNSLLAKRKINWSLNESYLKIIIEAIKNSFLYEKYMNTPAKGFEDDKQFVVDLFCEIIAPNDKFNEHLEDLNISWIDDIPIVNTLISKQLSGFKKDQKFKFKVPAIYKDLEDKDFAKQLFRKVVLNEEKLAKEFSDKTPNWDTERIAELDSIILKMAIAELLHFPSIPVKVTINEYVEIAKEYATPKSSIFINGILDKLSKEYITKNKNLKIGRGLL